MEVMTHIEFLRKLDLQHVSGRHLAFKCVVCGTVQSMQSFVNAGATREQAERQIGFSCIGRWTNAGPHKKASPPGSGCDWTLGGLLGIHKLVVATDDGKKHPHFEIATPEDARRLAIENEKLIAVLNISDVPLLEAVS